MKKTPSPRERGDAWLAEGLCRGEPAAWAELCEIYGTALYRFVFHRSGGDTALAEDIRQETLLAAADAIHAYRGEAPLFGWLCAIARHKLADEFRRRNRLTGGISTPDSRPGKPSVPADPRGSPEDLLAEGELRAAAVEAVWGLPESQREILLLRYVEEASVQSIASQRGLSYKAAESLLSRARASLRARMEETQND
jgi:RNA polymerase sigma-70 factor (ECF subfamily)